MPCASGAGHPRGGCRWPGRGSAAEELPEGRIGGEEENAGGERETKDGRGHKLILDVSADSVEPAWKPARFVSRRRRVTDSPGQNPFRGFGKVFHSFATTACLGHFFEDLQQTPTLSRISLGGKNTFSFEVHVINQRVTSHCGTGDVIELLAHLRSLGLDRFSQHFLKRLLQTFDQKIRLEIDGLREELTQFCHLFRLACSIEFAARSPGAISLGAQEFRELDSTRGGKTRELRETLLERPANAFRVPDEVTDAEGSEILTFIPRREPGQSSIALVLPDLLADPPGLGGGEFNRRRGSGSQKKRREDNGSPRDQVSPPA